MPFYNEIQLQALKEATKAILGRLDKVITVVKTSPQNIRVDMGDATRQMEESAKKLSELLSGIIASVQKTAEAQSKTFTSSNAVDKLVDIKKTLDRLALVIKENKVVPDTTEQKKTNKLLAELSQKIGSIKLEERAVDLSPIENAIKNNKFPNFPDTVSLDDGSKAHIASLMKMMSKFKFPDTIKIDDMQLRALSSGRGVAVVGGGGQIQATRTTITNLELTDANTEYSFAFPHSTVGWVIKTRAQSVKLLYAWATGKLPTSGDGEAYITIPQNYLKSQDNVNYGNKTIYLQADVAGTVVEIETFIA